MKAHRIVITMPAVLSLLLTAASPLPASAQWRSDGVPVCESDDSQVDVTSVSDGAGGAIIAWMDAVSLGVSVGIAAQRVGPDGVPHWTANGVPVGSAANSPGHPQMATDGSGGAIIAWVDSRIGANFGVYVQRMSAVGAPQWVADGVALCTTADPLGLAIAEDGAGGAIVAWVDSRDGTGDIYVQRIDSSGAPQWTANGVPLCTAANDQENPALVSSDGGGAIVAWEDNRGGAGRDIYAQRVDQSGAPQWTSNGVALCAAENMQLNPAIVTDGVNGAIVAWNDARNSPAIYAQRMDTGGAPQWPENGVRLCSGGGGLVATTDGANGAIVTYYISFPENPMVPHIFAQRVTGAGIPQWTADGVAVCIAGGLGQDTPALVPDGASGAIIAWVDGRDGSADIYAQRISATGAPQWITDGVPICTATNHQQDPAITSDDDGGAIISWMDARGGVDTDIFAQRVTSGGMILAVPDSRSRIDFTLLPPVPNPSRAGTIVAADLPSPTSIWVSIVDLRGRLVRILADGIEAGPGRWSASWDGLSESAGRLPPGIYFVRLATREGVFARKLAVLK